MSYVCIPRFIFLLLSFLNTAYVLLYIRNIRSLSTLFFYIQSCCSQFRRTLFWLIKVYGQVVTQAPLPIKKLWLLESGLLLCSYLRWKISYFYNLYNIDVDSVHLVMTFYPAINDLLRDCYRFQKRIDQLTWVM